MYNSCPHRWELTYIKKLREYTPSIHTVFGTAFHETMQHWITVLYEQGKKASEQMNLHTILMERMVSTYKTEIAKSKKPFCTPADLKEFHTDGIEILDWIVRKRSTYFSTKHITLIGVEIPLNVPITDKNVNVVMNGFIDLIFYDSELNKYFVWDIKTSTRGWSAADKKDKSKLSQLVLYKEFLARQLGIDPNSIEVKFFVVRRKVATDSAFPMKRVQEIKPSSGPNVRKKLIKEIESFIENAFYADGTKNDTATYPAIAGPKKVNCKYCEFKNRFDLCPLGTRLEKL